MSSLTPQSVLRGFSLNAAARIAAALLGVVQLLVLGHLFGTGWENDAWQAASAIPLFFGAFLTRALHTAFIPIYVERVEQDSGNVAPLVNGFFSLLLVVMAAGSALLWLAAPGVVGLQAAGFGGEQRELAVTLVRYLSPLLLVTVVAEVPVALYLSHRSYTLPAIGSLCYAIGVVGFTLVLGHTVGVKAAAIGAVAGVAVEAAMFWVAMGKVLPRPRFILQWTDRGIRQMMRLLGPSFISLGTVQLNTLVDIRFASYLGVGLLTGLNYGQKLTRIPLILFTGPLARTVTPVFAAQAARGDTAAMVSDLGRYMRLAAFISCGVAIVLVGVPVPIISVIFERGAFDAKSVDVTAVAMQAYTLGMPAYAVRLLLTTVFLALQDTKTPMWIAIAGVVVNIGADYVGMKFFGHAGIALATAIVETAATAALLVLLRRKLGPLGGRATALALAKCAGVALVCGVGLRFTINSVSVGSTPLGLLAALLVAGAVYAVGCYAAGVEEIRDGLTLLRKRDME